jgi:hypothetical protein
LKRTCKECNLEKDIIDFYKRSKRENSYLYVCKDCCKEKQKTNRSNNKEYYDSYNKKYHNDNRDRLNEYYKKWREENKNCDLYKENRKKYYELNSKIIKEKNYDYCKSRRKNDSLYKLKLNIRSLILTSFKNKYTKKSKKTIDILGCSFEQFKFYLESKFDENMNWENHGSYWHIDHIKPISLAKNEKEVYDLNHYSNFQPLFWLDNLIKSNNYMEN